MKFENKHYKVSNFTNSIIGAKLTDEEVAANESIKNFAPGADFNEGLRLRGDSNEFVKTPWNMEFMSNGTSTRKFIYGPTQRTELRNFVRKEVLRFGLEEIQHGNIGNGLGYGMSNWLRFISHNSLTGEQGWYNIPKGAIYDDVLYETTNTDFTNKTYYDIPNQTKLDEMIAAGIMSDDYVIHEVFPKYKHTKPSERIYTPGMTTGHIICASFAYQRDLTKDINMYSNWHSAMHVKRTDQPKQINRAGSGRNYLVSLADIKVMTPERRLKLLPIGRPIALESDHVVVNPGDKGFILHIHEINTEDTPK